MVIDVKVDASSGRVVVPYPPTPQNSLFFYVSDQIQVQFDDEKGFVLQPRSVIVGPQLTPVKIDINQRHKAVRVGFQPGGLHRMLGYHCMKWPMVIIMQLMYLAIKWP